MWLFGHLTNLVSIDTVINFLQNLNQIIAETQLNQFGRLTRTAQRWTIVIYFILSNRIGPVQNLSAHSAMTRKIVMKSLKKVGRGQREGNNGRFNRYRIQDFKERDLDRDSGHPVRFRFIDLYQKCTLTMTFLILNWDGMFVLKCKIYPNF